MPTWLSHKTCYGSTWLLWKPDEETLGTSEAASNAPTSSSAVRVINPDIKKSTLVYAQLDTASQATLISERPCNELELKRNVNVSTAIRTLGDFATKCNGHSDFDLTLLADGKTYGINYRVNAFTVKKYMWHLQQFFCIKKQMLLSDKKFFKKIASRCDSSKILDANKLYRKLDRVVPALLRFTPKRRTMQLTCCYEGTCWE